MMLIVAGFLSTLVITFVLVLVAAQPTPLQRTIAQRLSQIGTAAVDRNDLGGKAGQLLKLEKITKFGRLDALLEQYRFFKKLQKVIHQADSTSTAGGVVLTSLALAAGAFPLTYVFIPVWPINLLFSCGAAFLPYTLFTLKGRRRVRSFDLALPAAIDMMARALRAGHSLVSSIEMIALQAPEPVASEFAEVFKLQNFGLPLRETLLHIMDRVPSQDLRVLVTAILVQKDTGGNLAEILDRTVFVIRERLRIQGEIRIQTAQGRMTGWILTLLPAVMLLLINVVNPGYSRILLEDPLGRKLIYAGLGLMGMGAFFIRRITNGIEV